MPQRPPTWRSTRCRRRAPARRRRPPCRAARRFAPPALGRSPTRRRVGDEAGRRRLRHIRPGGRSPGKGARWPRALADARPKVAGLALAASAPELSRVAAAGAGEAARLLQTGAVHRGWQPLARRCRNGVSARPLPREVAASALLERPASAPSTASERARRRAPRPLDQHRSRALRRQGAVLKALGTGWAQGTAFSQSNVSRSRRRPGVRRKTVQRRAPRPRVAAPPLDHSRRATRRVAVSRARRRRDSGGRGAAEVRGHRRCANISHHDRRTAPATARRRAAPVAAEGGSSSSRCGLAFDSGRSGCGVHLPQLSSMEVIPGSATHAVRTPASTAASSLPRRRRARHRAVDGRPLALGGVLSTAGATGARPDAAGALAMVLGGASATSRPHRWRRRPRLIDVYRHLHWQTSTADSAIPSA